MSSTLYVGCLSTLSCRNIRTIMGLCHRLGLMFQIGDSLVKQYVYTETLSNLQRENCERGFVCILILGKK